MLFEFDGMEVDTMNTSNSSCEAPGSTWGKIIVIPVLYVVVAAVICLGNILVLDCYRKVESARTVTNVFIMQLAIADLWVGITLPVISSFYIVRKMRLIVDIHDICVFSYTLFILPATASILGLLLMTLDRFLSILFPLKYRVKMNKRKAYIFAICVVWFPAISGAFILPNVWKSDPGEYIRKDNITNCTYYTDCDLVTTMKAEYLEYVFIPGFLVVAVIIFVLYIPILHAVRKHLAQHKISLEKGTKTKLNQNVIQRKEIKMMTTTIVILGAFFLCWMPLMLVLGGEVYFSMDISKYRAFMYIPTMFNSALNPIIYALRVPIFNRLLCKRLPCLKPLQMERTSDTGRALSKSGNEMNQLSVQDGNNGSTNSITQSTSLTRSPKPKIVFRTPGHWPSGKYTM